MDWALGLNLNSSVIQQRLKISEHTINNSPSEAHTVFFVAGWQVKPGPVSFPLMATLLGARMLWLVLSYGLIYRRPTCRRHKVGNKVWAARKRILAVDASHSFTLNQRMLSVLICLLVFFPFFVPFGTKERSWSERFRTFALMKPASSFNSSNKP